jgi:hypothetical protein
MFFVLLSVLFFLSSVPRIYGGQKGGRDFGGWGESVVRRFGKSRKQVNL